RPATATTDLYTLSLHDALPISLFDRRVFGHLGKAPLVEENLPVLCGTQAVGPVLRVPFLLLGEDRIRRVDDGYSCQPEANEEVQDRKSTRLNSSHVKISYAVFC